MGIVESLVQAALLGEAIDGANVAVFVSDESMRYIAVNQGACEGLGYTRGELLALRVSQVAVYREAPAEFDEVVREGVGTGTSELTRKDGSTVRFRYSASKSTVAGLPVWVSVGEFDAPSG